MENQETSYRDNKTLKDLKPNTFYQQQKSQGSTSPVFQADEQGFPRNLLTHEVGPKGWNYVPLTPLLHLEEISELINKLKISRNKIIHAEHNLCKIVIAKSSQLEQTTQEIPDKLKESTKKSEIESRFQAEYNRFCNPH